MDILQFVIERFNYWIFTVLMMVGLYTVIARGNLVKKIIGLNIFQTSVFIYYISIGKVSGGTAPIFTTEHQKELKKHEHHGDAHHGDGHQVPTHQDGGHQDTAHQDGSHQGDAHDSADPMTMDLHAGDLHAGDANTSATLTRAGEHHGVSTPDLHDGDANALHAPANDALVSQVGDHGGDHGGEIATNATEFIEPLYSNPLPHVLILTAIVVGVATTAVGLALAVRIREAYGTIEEDELETADNVAEFGVADPRQQQDGGQGAGRLNPGGAQ